MFHQFHLHFYLLQENLLRVPVITLPLSRDDAPCKRKQQRKRKEITFGKEIDSMGRILNPFEDEDQSTACLGAKRAGRV